MNIYNRLNESWQPMSRKRHIIAKNLKLKDKEYRLWDLYIAVCGWDRKYRDHYKVIPFTDKVVSEVLGWDESKVCTVRNKLIEKGVVQKIENGIYKLLLIPTKDEETSHAMLHEVNVNKHVKNAESQEKNVDLQPIRGRNSSDSLVSYKGILVISSHKEYEEVKEKEDVISKNIDELHGWNSDDPKHKAMVKEQQRLAGMMLEYEIENDLIPELL